MNDEIKEEEGEAQENNPGIIVQSENNISHKKLSFLEFLSKLSPGKPLRSSLDDIKGAQDGSLIVIDCPPLKDLIEGGFRVNCKFTPQKLAELSKMDGAIILSDDLKKILSANVFLIPDTRIPSNETGTRHKAAERTSIQVETPVIAVSERRGKISVFYENKKYTLQDSENLLRRATENLNILEKQRELFNDLLINLNILETTNLVSISDVCSMMQRVEIITRVMNTLRRYIIELGKEGVIIQMRVRELAKGIDGLRDILLKDYSSRPASSKRILSSINFDGLLDLGALARLVFQESLDNQVSPRGFRLLGKLNLTEREINIMIATFGNLNNLLNAEEEEIEKILKHKTQSFKKEFEHLKEQIMMGKKL